MSNDSPKPQRADHEKDPVPEWVTKIANEKGLDSQHSAAIFHAFDRENHYQGGKTWGEGPDPAMRRLQTEGFLPTVSVGQPGQQFDIKTAAQEKVKSLKDQGLPIVFKGTDAVLDQKEQAAVLGRLFEQEKKRGIAEGTKDKPGLASTRDEISAAMTPEIRKGMQQQHPPLETDPQKLHDNMVKAITLDSMPIKVMEQRQDKHDGFPILAGYVATGAITMTQEKAILDRQQELRATHPNERPPMVGNLLREMYPDRVAAADAADKLLTKLQPQKPAPAK